MLTQAPETPVFAPPSWAPDFGKDTDGEPLIVPRMADMLEAILVGSIRAQDELPPEQEFGVYRRVVRDLYQRLNELESQYQ